MSKDLIPKDTLKLITEWKSKNDRLAKEKSNIDKLLTEALEPIANLNRTRNPFKKVIFILQKYLAYKRLVKEIEENEFNSEELFR